jgi:hypothetical protein
MRFKSRGALLALAVFAMSAIAVSAASAATLPEFKPVPTKKKFTSTSGTVTWRFGTETIVCTKSATAGEFTGTSTLGKIVIKFTGCALKAKQGSNCPLKSTNTTTEGEIVTNALKGELGTVSTKQAASGVGLLLEPETGKVISTIAGCGTWPETALEGALAGEVATVGKKQATNKLVFGVASGNQDIKEITVKSGTKSPKFSGWGVSSITDEASDELTFEEAVEVT